MDAQLGAEYCRLFVHRGLRRPDVPHVDPGPGLLEGEGRLLEVEGNLKVSTEQSSDLLRLLLRWSEVPPLAGARPGGVASPPLH